MPTGQLDFPKQKALAWKITAFAGNGLSARGKGSFFPAAAWRPGRYLQGSMAAPGLSVAGRQHHRFGDRAGTADFHLGDNDGFMRGALWMRWIGAGRGFCRGGDDGGKIAAGRGDRMMAKKRDAFSASPFLASSPFPGGIYAIAVRNRPGCEGRKRKHCQRRCCRWDFSATGSRRSGPGVR